MCFSYPHVRPMQIVHQIASPDALNASACSAMARTLNAALDGAPIDGASFKLACDAGGYDPEKMLCSLVGVGLLHCHGGKIYLGEVGRAFVTSWYLLA